MILTFHRSPLASEQELCEIDSSVLLRKISKNGKSKYDENKPIICFFNFIENRFNSALLALPIFLKFF